MNELGEDLGRRWKLLEILRGICQKPMLYNAEIVKSNCKYESKVIRVMLISYFLRNYQRMHRVGHLEHGTHCRKHAPKSRCLYTNFKYPSFKLQVSIYFPPLTNYVRFTTHRSTFSSNPKYSTSFISSKSFVELHHSNLAVDRY